MADVKVKLLKPLDGRPIGDDASYPENEVQRLERLGAVKRLQEPENKKAAEPRNKSARGDAQAQD